MRIRWPAALSGIVALAATLPLTAQTPERVLGAPYHHPGRAFIDLMVPHHEMAVMMSRHALAGARNEGVRGLARRMVEEQSGEIAELKRLRRSLFGSDSTRGHMMQGMMQMMGMHQMPDTVAPRAGRDSMAMRHPMPMPRDSAAMRQPMRMPMSRDSMPMRMMAGDHDRMFLEHMIQHHQAGADLSVLAEDSQAPAAVKELARRIRVRQEQELAEMRRLLGTLAAPAHDH